MIRVVEGDALAWMQEEAKLRVITTGVIAVLPDADELDLDLDAYRLWFARTIRLCFAAGNGPTAFKQTDRLAGGIWHDKAAWISAQAPRPLTWHKIALRRGPGATDLHRPTYSHLLAYGGRPGRRTPDVIDGGKPAWRNGIGPAAAQLLATWMAEQQPKRVLVPFCGVGTILRALAEAGVEHVVGCELDPDRAQEARNA